jgi:phage gp45-like
VSGPSIEELSRITDPERRSSVGQLRRMVVKVTSRALWQLVGYKIDAFVQTLAVEPFTGIGFFSRPPRDGKPEGIVAYVGGAQSPAVIALRDEKTRARVVGDIAEGETAVFSDGTVVHLRAGTIEVRLANGTAVPLATLADVQALWQYITTMVLPVSTTGTAATQSGFAGPPPSAPVVAVPPVPAMPAPPAAPAGTTVLRGQ